MIASKGWMAGWLVVLAASGCSSFKAGLGGDPVAAAPVAYPPPAMVAVEFKSYSGKSKVEEVPFERGMTVGDALEKTRAHKRFRRILVDLQRSPPGGTPHKMAIDFDNGANRVAHTCNYDLHANDRVVVTEDTSNILDDLMSKVSPASGKRR